MALANGAAQLIPELFRQSAADDWDKAIAVHKEIVDAEAKADKVKRSIRRHLPKSLFLPVPRSDLLTLVGIQDHVANTAKDITMLVIGRQMRFPEKLAPQLSRGVAMVSCPNRPIVRAVNSPLSASSCATGAGLVMVTTSSDSSR